MQAICSTTCYLRETVHRSRYRYGKTFVAALFAVHCRFLFLLQNFMHPYRFNLIISHFDLSLSLSPFGDLKKMHAVGWCLDNLSRALLEELNCGVIDK